MFSPCFPDSRMSLFSAKLFIWKQLLGEIFSFYKYGWLFLESVCYSQQSLYYSSIVKYDKKKRLFCFYSFGSYSSKSCIRTPQFQFFVYWSSLWLKSILENTKLMKYVCWEEWQRRKVQFCSRYLIFSASALWFGIKLDDIY